MTDYSKVPDYEINAMVGEALGMTAHFIEHDGRVKFRDTSGRIQGTKDYCNNPADAWPIIIANRISLMFDKSTEEGNEAKWCLASSSCDQYIVDYVSEQKLLRAAMIVFLMMKESDNEVR